MGFTRVVSSIYNEGDPRPKTNISPNDLIHDLPITVCTFVQLSDILNIPVGYLNNSAYPVFQFNWLFENLKTGKVQNFDLPHGHYLEPIDDLQGNSHNGQSQFILQKYMKSAKELGFEIGTPYTLKTVVSFEFVSPGTEASSVMSIPRIMAAPEQYFITFNLK